MKYEAEQRQADPDCDVSTDKIAGHAGVQLSTIRTWQGNKRTDDAQMRRRRIVWRSIVAHILSKIEQWQPTDVSGTEKRKFKLIKKPAFENDVTNRDDH